MKKISEFLIMSSSQSRCHRLFEKYYDNTNRIFEKFNSSDFYYYKKTFTMQYAKE